MKRRTHLLLAGVATLFLTLALSSGCLSQPAKSGLIPAGVARVDISPPGPVRLMGYAARAQLPAPTNILQRIHARALALGAGRDAAVLLTIDNCILPGAITQEIRARLARQLGLTPERIALTVTHTHSAPILAGAAPNIFAIDMSAEDHVQVGAYTRFFTDRLEEAALLALKDRQPARLAWAQGRAGFAKNRRTAGGPVDHDLPLLRITSPEGQLRGLLVNYACHCTTLGGEVNAVHGDWAGSAALAIERDHPATVALIAIGAGADANPEPRGTLALADQHGEEVARETSRLLSLQLTELTNAPTCRLRSLDLPFQTHFTRLEWERRATNSGIVGHHARKWLARLDRGETLPPTLPYPIQTWTFGDQLALVFLGGEVVVDYSLRLKRELDPRRLWVNGYANDVPCYIPSRRILSEGGYEAEFSLWYYDRPQQLAPAVEDQIINAVRELLPPSYLFDEKRAENPPPKSPAESLKAFRTRAGLEVELVASEPLIESPVAIDFGVDGRLWVCEMRDYPSGLDGKGLPGGRIKVLTDTNGDGRFDHAEIMADGLPFPTGLMAWGDGVIACAAPDVWLVHPTPGGTTHSDPSKPEIRTPAGWQATKLLTGFATHNFQARVNGLRWGLDGWIYGSGGLFGGRITNPQTGQTYDCSNRDFRFKPDTGEFEPLAGVSQQGRVRNDFGDWFGQDNSTLLWHFPLPDHYARRNPHVTPPPARIFLAAAGGEDIGQIFPASRTLLRFNDPQTANRLTSACGPEIYRDDFLGAGFLGNAFVCEPVHNLVRRAIVVPDSISFATHRATDEASSEFLASTDNWCRPVEVRTGPDGALWVVDMYRFVVEHPRWIPAERLKELDVRGGATMGRIWRVFPAGKKPRPIRNLARLTPVQLAEVLDSPNGVERDLAHRRLWEMGRTGMSNALPASSLIHLASSARRPASRAQSLFVLDQLQALPMELLDSALHDPDPDVRRTAVLFAEPKGPQAYPSSQFHYLMGVTNDPDARVRYQLALTLGQFRDPRASLALAVLAQRDANSPWHRAAILSSVLAAPEAVAAVFASQTDPSLSSLRDQTLATFVAAEHAPAVAAWIQAAWGSANASERTAEALGLLAALQAHPRLSAALESDPAAARLLASLRESFANRGRALATDGAQPTAVRAAAITLLAESARTLPGRLDELVSLLETELPPAVQPALFAGLRRQESAKLATQVLNAWKQRPATQRTDLAALLLSRDAWTSTLLDAVTAGTVAPAELSPVQRQQLRQHANATIREHALALFPAAASDRTQVVARYSEVGNLVGEPTRGAGHFDRLCATCHSLRGHGNAVGPDLAPFRGKPVGDYLTAILDPNAAIEPRFIAWTAELKDGRALTGIVRDESATGLKVIQPSGQTETIRRSDLASLTPNPQSLMPEGLEQSLAPADLADLIAWIKSTPAAFGSAGTEQATAARRQFASLAPTKVTALESPYDALPYASWLGTLPLHYCRQTDGQSKLTVRFSAPASGSGPTLLRFAAGMGFVSQPDGKFTLRLNGTPLLDFDVALDDATWRSPDGRVVLRYLVRENGGQDSNGVLELELPEGLVKPGAINELSATGSANESQRWFGLYGWPDR